MTGLSQVRSSPASQPAVPLAARPAAAPAESATAKAPAEPVFIPKGTRLAIISHFDNSLNNPLNPDPTKVVRWGEASEMEMMDGWIEYLDAPVDGKGPLRADLRK